MHSCQSNCRNANLGFNNWGSIENGTKFTFTFIRCFYPKRLSIAFRLYIFISMCVLWESNPQPFAQLTQCSTTESHRNKIYWMSIYYAVNGNQGSTKCKGFQTDHWKNNVHWWLIWILRSVFNAFMHILYPKLLSCSHINQWIAHADYFKRVQKKRVRKKKYHS